MKAEAAAVSPDVKVEAAEEPASGAGVTAKGISRTKRIALPIIAAGVVLVVWEVIVRVLKIPSVILPPPSEVWETLLRTYPLLLQHAVPTMLETVIGFVLAVVLGVALAVVITYSPTWHAVLYPNLVLFQLIPKVALAPLFIVWLGIGMESRLFFALFIAFFPIVISMATGLAEVDRSLLRLCRSLTASEWQVFVNVRFPFSLPYLFSGMKIGMTMAMIGVIVGEFITAQAGLGYLIVFATSRAETAVIMAAIAVLCALGLALYGLVLLGELGMKRWYYGRSPG
jgi:NitT/TauT family transport system permease protein